jgi:predicted  nucleic acid-binding Zn-ribbon protein
MAGPAVILRELHRLRRFARDLQTKIEQGPRTLQAQHGRVARQEEALRQAQEGLKKLKVKTHEMEVSHKTTLQQIAKYEKQQDSAAGKKEYDALRHEIDAAKKKVQQLEDDIIDALSQTEEEAARLPELERALKQVKEEVAAYERDSDSRLAGFAEQLKLTQGQIAETEGNLPPDVRTVYNRLVAARGEDALTAVEQGTCTACYTSITAQAYNDLAVGNFVLCKSCGRILYLAD